MKDRISSFISFIETANEEVKKYEEHIAEIASKMASEEDEDVKKDLAAEHYGHTFFLSLIRQDVIKSMNKLSECYASSVLMGVDLKLTEDETKILKTYSEQSDNIFGLVNGKIVSKNTELLKITLEHAKSIKNKPFIDQYIKENSIKK